MSVSEGALRVTIGSILIPKSALGRFAVALLGQPEQPEQEDWRGENSLGSAVAVALRSCEMKRADFHSTKPRQGSKIDATAIHCMSIHCMLNHGKLTHCIKIHGMSGTYPVEEQTSQRVTWVCSS